MSSRVSKTTKLDTLQSARLAKKEARLGALMSFYQANPTGTPTQAAHALAVSRQTIYTYISELEAAGQISRNGDGVVVLERQ